MGYKTIAGVLFGWVVLCSILIVVLSYNHVTPTNVANLLYQPADKKPGPPPDVHIGFTVEYIKAAGNAAEIFIPAFAHLPKEGFLHFVCRDGNPKVSINMAAISKIETVYGDITKLSKRDLACVGIGSPPAKIPNIRIT